MLLAQAFIDHYNYRGPAVAAEVDAAESMLATGEYAYARYTDEQLDILSGLINTLRSGATRNVDPETTLRNATLALQLLPETLTAVRSLAELSRLSAMVHLGQEQEVVAYVQAWRQQHAGRPPDLRSCRLLLVLGATYLNNVNLPALAETAAALQSAAERAQRPFFSAWARFGQGCLHYQRNELVDAIENFRSVNQLREWCHSRVILEILGGLALALHAAGRQAEAETVVAELREYVAENDLVNLRMLPEALALRISSEQDRYAVGKRQLEAFSAQPAAQIALGLIEAPALVAVRVGLRQGRRRLTGGCCSPFAVVP